MTYGIRFFRKTETDGKQTLCIEVPEDATREDLESVGRELTRWHQGRATEQADTGLELIGAVTEYAITRPSAPLYLDRLRVRVIGRLSDNRPRLCIELTPETGIKDVELQWEKITPWRDAIFAEWPDDVSLRTLLMIDLDRRKTAGESYAALADWLNDRIEAALLTYKAWQDSGAPLEGVWLLGFSHPRYGKLAAMELLRWFGQQRSRKATNAPMDDDNRINLLDAALVELDQGRPAFDDCRVQAPIQADMVRARLRQWRKGGG